MNGKANDQSDVTSIDNAEKDRILGELLKIKMNEINSMLPQYIASFAIYITITGGLLKFALDAAAPLEQRHALTAFGVALSGLGLVTCLLGAILRSRLVMEIRDISVKLDLPVLTSSFMPLLFATILMTVFISLCLAGWICLLLK